MIRLNTFIKMNMLQVICAVFILTFGSFCTGESGICQPFEMKSKYLNKQLVGHSVSESIGLGLKECVEGCMSLSVCKSTDYYMPSKTCKLNDVDSSSVDISEFRSLNGAVFSDISEWPEMMVGSCSSRPCTKSQRCYDDMGNFHCVDLTCKKPLITDGKLMLSAPDNKKFLDTATVECRAGYIPDIQSVKCQASGTWEQATCIDINECSSDPCQNGGSCVDAINMYTCTCAPGYTGKDCETDINECSSDPCQNGGTCVDAINMYTCTCAPGYTGKDCETGVSDCYDVLYDTMGKESGIYQVRTQDSLRVVDVLCDMETSGGGWTVFQQRFNGSVDFYRNFHDYTQGFGSLDGEFWLGLENIYEMLSHGSSELSIDLMAANGSTAYELYQNFSLSPGPNYTLHIGTASGTAGDYRLGLSYHNGYNFYTYDHDNSYACASTQIGHGGWWYRNCAHVNLNGEYVTPGALRQPVSQGGVIYYAFQQHRSLKRSKMMFRRTRN